MKHLFYLCIALFVISCSPSNERKVKNAFKEYVKSNFDDPSQFVEIVSIDSLDTISTISAKRVIKEYLELEKKKDVLCDSLQEIIMKYYKSKGLKLREVLGLEDMFEQAERLLYVNYNLSTIGIHLDNAERDLNEIFSMKDSVFLEEVISYRVKEKESVKLKKIYAYSDTLFNIIQFKNERLKVNDNNVYKKINDFEEKYRPLFNLYRLRLYNQKQIVTSLKAHFGE